MVAGKLPDGMFKKLLPYFVDSVTVMRPPTITEGIELS